MHNAIPEMIEAGMQIDYRRIFEHLPLIFQESSKRVASYTSQLYNCCLEDNIYIQHPVMNEALRDYIFEAVKYFNIGRAGLPPELVLQRHSSVPSENELIKKHTNIGFNIMLSGTPDDEMTLTGKEEPDKIIRHLASDAAISHHERWDGSGYPYMDAGEDIPLLGRMVSLCEYFDSRINSKRDNKESIESFREKLNESAGKTFDPKLAEYFSEIIRKFMPAPFI